MYTEKAIKRLNNIRWENLGEKWGRKRYRIRD